MEELKDEPAKRFDKGKIRYSLLPWGVVGELVKVYEYGCEKYERDNWKRGMSWSRVYDSLMRHLQSFWSGEELDPESGLHHLAHVIWNSVTLLWYVLNRKGIDDRQ